MTDEEYEKIRSYNPDQMREYIYNRFPVIKKIKHNPNNYPIVVKWNNKYVWKTRQGCDFRAFYFNYIERKIEENTTNLYDPDVEYYARIEDI